MGVLVQVAPQEALAVEGIVYSEPQLIVLRWYITQVLRVII